MRAAAYLSVAIFAIGAYLMIAATFLFSPTWIAIGMLATAATAAIGIVGVNPRTSVSR